MRQECYRVELWKGTEAPLASPCLYSRCREKKACIHLGRATIGIQGHSAFRQWEFPVLSKHPVQHPVQSLESKHSVNHTVRPLVALVKHSVEPSAHATLSRGSVYHRSLSVIDLLHLYSIAPLLPKAYPAIHLIY